MPKISVIMPAYNAERYIREAIDSILRQTWSDFELIIIDDGSTDSTAAIIAEYTDNRIRFCPNAQNMGVAATLNRGLSSPAGRTSPAWMQTIFHCRNALQSRRPIWMRIRT